MVYTIINGSVRHDNRLYQEGDTLPSIGAEEAAILLELGVIAEAELPAAKAHPSAKVNTKND